MDKNRFRLEFIITYNKEIYNSENPNEESLKLIEMGKYRKQNIYSLSLNRIQLNEILAEIKVDYELDKLEDAMMILIIEYRKVRNKKRGYK